MLVSEAKEKVCPFIQQYGVVSTGINHSNEFVVKKHLQKIDPANINCMASGCMAWKYTNTSKEIDIQRCECGEKRADYLGDNKYGNKHCENCNTYTLTKEKISEEIINEDGKEGYCMRLNG